MRAEMVVSPGPEGEGGLSVSGEVDLTSADRLRLAIIDVATREDGDVEVDLSQVTFIDSSGLGALLAAHRALTTLGSTLTVTNPTPMTSKLLEITGMNGVIDIRR